MLPGKCYRANGSCKIIDQWLMWRESGLTVFEPDSANDGQADARGRGSLETLSSQGFSYCVVWRRRDR